MISLSQLLTTAPEHQVVAYVDGQEIDFARFRKDVGNTLAGISEKKLILFEDSSYRFAVGMMAALHGNAHIILPPNGLPVTLENIEGERLDTSCAEDAKVEFRELNPQQCILDFYTSGSTGEAKTVRKHLFQLENEVTALEETWRHESRATQILSTVSHQHIYGMLFKVLWPLSCGYPFVDEKFEYWEDLVPHLSQQSIIVSSPAHLSRFPDLNIPTKPKVVFSSGAPLSLDIAIQSASILGTVPIEVYGSTETGGIAYRQQTRPNIAWQPFRSINVNTDDTGVLSIRSPYLANNDWYETSDRIEWTENGRFFLIGRVDRIVKIEGKRVSLPEVEASLCECEWAKDACCLVIPNERHSLSAVVVLSTKGQEKLDKIGKFRMGRFLREQLANKLEPAARPKRWRFVDEVPVNSQGKRLMAELLALY